MPIAATNERIILHSQPFSRRSGLAVMLAGLVVSGFFAVIWFLFGLLLCSMGVWLGLILLFSSVAFSTVLFLFSRGLLRNSFSLFELEITVDELVFTVEDKFAGKKGLLMILLSDVKYGEYYPSPDSASIIFHTNYSQQEVPLWPFPNAGADAVDFLRGAGVILVNLQSDEQIPV